jgi:hypothetical protein
LRFDQETNFLTAKDTINQLPQTYDLFIAEYPREKPLLRRVTQTEAANETQAMEYDKRHFTYLSDENGIVNRYIARIDSTISFVDTTTHYRYFTTSFPVSNYSYSIVEQDVSRTAKKTGEILFKNNRYYMYVQDLVPTKQLKALQLQKTYYMNQYLEQLEARKADTVKSTLTPQEQQYIQEKRTRQRPARKPASVLIDEMDAANDTSAVNINNYTFGNAPADSVKDTLKPKKILPSFVIPRQENYNVEYFINQLVTQLDFNFLNTTYQPYSGGNSPIYLNPGFNALFKLGVIDLMEDFRITGGFRLSVDLDNNEFFLAFDNYKHRLDKTLVLHRQAMENLTDYSLVKIRTHDVQYVIKWPFSNTLAIKGSGIVRWDKTIYASTDIQNLMEPTTNEFLSLIHISEPTRPY